MRDAFRTRWHRQKFHCSKLPNALPALVLLGLLLNPWPGMEPRPLREPSISTFSDRGIEARGFLNPRSPRWFKTKRAFCGLRPLGGWLALMVCGSRSSIALATQESRAIESCRCWKTVGDGCGSVREQHGAAVLEEGEWKAVTTPEGESLGEVGALVEGADGMVWMATIHGIVGIGDGRFERFTEDDGLPDDLVRALLLDQKGGLWAGTEKGLASSGRWRRDCVQSTRSFRSANHQPADDTAR